jgi:hypothetical protein
MRGAAYRLVEKFHLARFTLDALLRVLERLGEKFSLGARAPADFSRDGFVLDA